MCKNILLKKNIYIYIKKHIHVCIIFCMYFTLIITFESFDSLIHVLLSSIIPLMKWLSCSISKPTKDNHLTKDITILQKSNSNFVSTYINHHNCKRYLKSLVLSRISKQHEMNTYLVDLPVQTT